jgi:hypothetical protein
MLTTNQRLDQLSAARVDFMKRGMLNGTLLESVLASNGTRLTFDNLLLFTSPRFLSRQ